MSILSFTPPRSNGLTAAVCSPVQARGIYGLVVVAAAVAGFLATDAGAAHTAAEQAGADLMRLMRAMAAIKAAMAAAAVEAVFWRLARPANSLRLATFALASAAMVAGPGLIWQMAHVGLGALLLHAGLASTIIVLWRDPTVAKAMDDIVKRRSQRR